MSEKKFEKIIEDEIEKAEITVAEKVAKEDEEDRQGKSFEFMSGMLSKKGDLVDKTIDTMNGGKVVEGEKLEAIRDKMKSETEPEKPEKKHTLELASQDEIKKMSVEMLKKEIEDVLSSPEFGRAKKFHEAEEKSEVFKEDPLNEDNKKWREQNEGMFEIYNNYLEALEKEKARKEKIEVEIKEKPQTLREILKERELLEEAEKLEEILVDRTKELAKMEDYINEKKKGEKTTKKEEAKRYRLMREVEVANSNVSLTGSVVSSLRKEKDLNEQILALTVHGGHLDNVLKAMEIEIKNEKIEKLSSKKWKSVNRFSNAITNSVIAKGINKYISPVVSWGVDKLPERLTHRNANNNQQTGEQKKGHIKSLWGKIFDKDEEEAEEEPNEKFKKEALFAYLDVLSISADSEIFEEKKAELYEGLDEGDGTLIVFKDDLEDVMDVLNIGRGEDKKEMMRIIRGFVFTEKEVKEAIKEIEAERATEDEEINYDDYEIVVEPSGKLVLWNKKDGDLPVEKGKVFKKGFVDNPNKIIKKLLEQGKEMDMLDVIFNEDEIDKVKNAKDVESLKEIVDKHLFKFDFHKDSNVATKYYHEFLFGLSGVLSNCYDSDKKKIDLNKLHKLDAGLFALDKNYNENADNYFVAVLEKLGIESKDVEDNDKEDSGEGESGEFILGEKESKSLFRMVEERYKDEKNKERFKKFDASFSAEEFRKLGNIRKPSDLKPVIELIANFIDSLEEGHLNLFPHTCYFGDFFEDDDLKEEYKFNRTQRNEAMIYNLNYHRGFFADLPEELKNAEKYVNEVLDIVDGLRKEILEDGEDDEGDLGEGTEENESVSENEKKNEIENIKLKIELALRSIKRENKDQFKAISGLIANIDEEKTVKENCEENPFFEKLLVAGLMSSMSIQEEKMIYEMKAKDLIEIYKELKDKKEGDKSKNNTQEQKAEEISAFFKVIGEGITGIGPKKVKEYDERIGAVMKGKPIKEGDNIEDLKKDFRQWALGEEWSPDFSFKNLEQRCETQSKLLEMMKDVKQNFERENILKSFYNVLVKKREENKIYQEISEQSFKNVTDSDNFDAIKNLTVGDVKREVDFMIKKLIKK